MPRLSPGDRCVITEDLELSQDSVFLAAVWLDKALSREWSHAEAAPPEEGRRSREVLGMRPLRPHRSSPASLTGPYELLVRGAKKATGHLFILTQSPVLCRRPQPPASCSGLICRWSSRGFLIFCCCSRFLISLGAERWGWAGLCGSFLFLLHLFAAGHFCTWRRGGRGWRAGVGGEGPLSQTLPPAPRCEQDGFARERAERRPAGGLSVVWRLAANLDSPSAARSPWMKP